ncbi:MAG: tetratricopeptide repeat protein [Gammaproteobacteria bacterium]
MSTQQTMQYAMRCHQRGRLAEAERLYRDVIRTEPQHCDALHLLGLIRIDQRDYQTGVRLIESAVAVNPRFAKAHFNLGVALTKLERYDDAVASFDHALRLTPEHVESWNARGNALIKAERVAEAKEAYDRALTLRPEHAGALLNRAAAFVRLEKLEEAQADLDRLLALDPNHVEAHIRRASLAAKRGDPLDAYQRLECETPDLSQSAEAWCVRGSALAQLRCYEEALEAYDRALELRSDYVDASAGRGGVLSMLRRFEEALLEYDRALRIDPDHVEALYNRGLALGELDRLEEALEYFERAVANKPRYLRGLANLVPVLARFRHFPQALECCDRALEIEPKHAQTLIWRADMLVKLRRFDDALAAYDTVLEVEPAGADSWFSLYLYLRKNICDWNGLDAMIARLRAGFTGPDPAPVAPLLLMSFDSTLEEKLNVARHFASTTPAPPSRKERPPEATFKPHERIRIAYISANFNRHPVAYTLAELMERHDRSKFDVIGISLGGDDRSDIRARIVSACTSFHDVNALSDEAAADLLRELEVDIAIDLMGHTEDSRRGMLALRCAPLQVNYLGFPGTSAEPYMDYLIADQYLIPSEHREGYTERLVRLPHSYMPIDTKWGASEHTPTRQSEGLPEQGFVFCAFTTHYKITPAVFDVWMRLLSQIESSVLWLQGANEVAERNLEAFAAERGVDPSRLIFAIRTPGIAEHLARHRLADLYLDTTPYNAHSTARDALWMGLPLLTIEGSSFASRVAGSILTAAGLPQLVAADLDAYESMALRLARDPQALADLKRHLAETRLAQPLFDMDLYRRHIEVAFTRMVERARRGEPPADFDIAALAQPPGD